MSATKSSRLWGKIIILVAVWGWCLAAQAKYAGGSGTEAEPFRVSEVADWQELMATPADWGGHFILTSDIDLNGVSITPIAPDTSTSSGFQGIPFTGVFDGNDYVIRKADVNMPGSNYVGLFGCLGIGGQIKNLAVQDTAVTGDEDVGGLLGSNSGTISNCYSTGSISGTGDYVGGLLGSNTATISNCYSTSSVIGTDDVGGLLGSNSGTISNCYSTGSVNGRYDVSGLVGYNYSGTIANCYSTGSVSGDYYVGGLVGSSYYGAISNCYSTSTVSGTGDYVGGLVGYNSQNSQSIITNCYSTGNVVGAEKTGGLVGSGSGHVINSYWNIETSGQAISAGGEAKTPTQMRMASTFFGWGFCDGVWTINEDLDYPRLAWEEKPGEPIVGMFPLDGNGDSNSPYLIHTPEELNLIGLLPCAWDKHFKGMADIDLSLYKGREFNITPNFAGIFDGNDHTISNFTYDSNGTNFIGLFGYVYGENAEIKNLGLIEPNVDAGTGIYVGSLVGSLGSGAITNCYSTGGSVKGASYVGGLVGDGSGTITNCYSTGNVTGTGVGSPVGGLVGSVHGTMTNCYSSGTVWAHGSVGGLAGSLYGNSIMTNCYSSTTVWGYYCVGGLVGYVSDPITNCYSTGIVTGEDYVGGLAGLMVSNSARVTNCYSSGAVWGETDVGGLVGDSHSGSRVYNSFWDTESSGQLTSAGGTGKKTNQMQMQGTFADAGWDIMGEAANSYGNTWRLCNERGEYPKLSWQYLPGDFLCPDYVEFVDFAYLAGCWLKPECGGADLTFDAIVDTLDLSVENDNWLTGMPPGQGSNQSPIDGATSVSTNADLNWTLGSFATSHDLYFGTSSPPPFIRSQTATVFDPGIIAAITKWYWRIDEVNAWGKSIGPVWTFTTGSPDQATNPDPVDGRTGVSNTAGLRWNAGFDAISHDIYFGTSNPPPFVRNQAATSFYPDIMSYNTKYYWRIDEVHAGGRTVGTVWTFTTGLYGGR